MSLLFGIAAAALAAISFGSADFAGGLASRRAGALTTALAVQLIGAAGLTLVLVVLREPLAPIAILAGLLAGVGVGLGLLALYAALAIAAMGPVAALTGLSASLGTLLFDLLVLGSTPSVLQGLGIVCAIGGGLTSTRLAAIPLGAVALCVIAGAAFGGSFVAFGLAHGERAVVVLLAARVVAVAILGAPWLFRGHRSRRVAHPSVVVAGLLDTVANLLMIVAVSLVPVSFATAIATAEPPIVTMILARRTLGEALPRAVYGSIALACLGMALLVIG